MKMPTPVDQLPSFNAGGKMPSQPGSNKWLPFIIVGGILITAIGISMTVNRKIYRDRIKLKLKENERETK